VRVLHLPVNVGCSDGSVPFSRGPILW